jgi:hypothetical protein
MKPDSTKNSNPIAPSSTDGGNHTGAHPRVTTPKVGKLMKKVGNAKGGTDPYVQAKPSRKFVTATGAATYGGIKTHMPAYKSAEAGETQGNGRLFQAAVKRTAPNFRAGIDTQS